MRNSNPKIVRILPSGAFECKCCGQIWYPNIKPLSSRLYYGSWQCPNQCKPDEMME